MKLNEQVAIVTGGSGGIGLAVAARLCRHVAAVVLSDIRDPASDVSSILPPDDDSARVDVSFRRADMTEQQDVHALVDYTMERHGRVDILVNNAGALCRHAPVWEMTSEEWDATLAVNLTSVFLGCREVLPHMIANSYGRIVNVASIAGKEGNPWVSPYNASKAGVIALTKGISKEVAQHGIMVNCVTPSMIETPMLADMDDESRERMLSKIPLGRPGQADEVAALIEFLASPDCSFSTGAAFDVSGGRATY